MAEMISELVSSDELLDWLGAGEESFGIVSALRASALESLHRATGIDWAAQTGRLETANEAIRTMVYLSFHGLRNPDIKTDVLERHLTGLMIQLQNGGDAIENSDG